MIVEDGSGLANSEAYISVADADAHFSARSNATWAALTDAQKEAALRNATDYMTQTYRLRWKGTRVSATQALDWPRAMVERPDYAYTGANGYTMIDGAYYFPSNEVPAEVARACAILALTASASDLAPNVGRLKSRVKVGPIETEYVAGSSALTRYTAVDDLLKPFLASRGFGTLMVERA